ncbi:MAG: hypothetical protein FJ387_29790 [Verrucomicrobia bacterium]|nr:hypothetical protein [Verrucomicrobiota bacterium]
MTRPPRQAALTVVYGAHAALLDYSFSSFARNPFLELHAFVLGDRLPQAQVQGITYHRRAPDPTFRHPMRDADFRRWLFLDELGVDFALVVDGVDVLCLQELPPIPELLRGGWVGACVEHGGGRFLAQGLYTSNFLNAGVTFWDVAATRQLRQEIVERGRTSFRNLVDDQLAFNELLHTRYFDRLTVLPCQYNFRGSLGPKPWGWPQVRSLDGVRIYHNGHWIDAAKRLLPVKPQAELLALPPDHHAPGRCAQWWRRWLCRWRRIG